MRKRTRIFGRTAPKIQLCETCGRMRCHHQMGYYKCDLPADVIDALRRFKAANGPRWRAKLRGHWERACADLAEPDRQLLQQARNVIGGRLAKVTL